MAKNIDKADNANDNDSPNDQNPLPPFQGFHKNAPFRFVGISRLSLQRMLVAIGAGKKLRTAEDCENIVVVDKLYKLACRADSKNGLTDAAVPQCRAQLTKASLDSGTFFRERYSHEVFASPGTVPSLR